MNEKIQKLVDAICELTVMEIKELTKALQEKLGITLEQPQQIIQQTQTTEEIAKEKASFDVWLKEVGLQKINVIKLVRALTNKSLMDSKAFADNTPQLIKGGANKAEAEELKIKFEEVGAVVEIK